MGDYFADLLGGLTSFKSQYDLFANLIGKAEAYAKAHGITEILITGHSLGGAMAEIYMAQHRNSPLNLVGVTFGSPGSKDILSTGVVDTRLINIGHAGDAVVNAFVHEVQG